MRKNIAEFTGTFWLVMGGCGSAILAAGFPGLGIGFLGVSFAFGLTVLTMAYSLGHISGAHLNPAVTIGLWAAGKLPVSDVWPYIISQVLGAVTAALFLFIIVTGNGAPTGNFAANGYGEYSPGNYNIGAAFITEFLMTFIFLIIILGATSEDAPKGMGGLTIGMALTLIHLISIPVTNTSVNPARSISQALFAGPPALVQLWLFIIAPVAGALTAGGLYRFYKYDV